MCIVFLMVFSYSAYGASSAFFPSCCLYHSNTNHSTDVMSYSGHSMRSEAKSLFFEAFFIDDQEDIIKVRQGGITDHAAARKHVRTYIPKPELLLSRFYSVVSRLFRGMQLIGWEGSEE